MTEIPIAEDEFAWIPSEAMYEALIVCVVLTPPVGLYFTEHLDVELVSGTNVQVLGAVKVPVSAEKVPVPLEEKITVPPGLNLVPVSVSVTVAVQVVLV